MGIAQSDIYVLPDATYAALVSDAVISYNMLIISHDGAPSEAWLNL